VHGSGRSLFGAAWIAALLIAGVPGGAAALTVQVVDPAGVPIDVGYSWVVEEDVTYGVNPGLPDPGSINLKFHKSWMPVVASGRTTVAGPAAVDVPVGKRYFVSVQPETGWGMGGAPVRADQTSVTIIVRPYPLPTAQMSVRVFVDNHPLNNVPELNEPGLPDVAIVLEDPGGRYGAIGGVISKDAFNNPLGTTYQLDPTTGQPLLDADGAPIVDVMGDGEIVTDLNGMAIIKYLPQGKFGVITVPPAGQGWQQVTTIEGSPVIDAWVNNNEPTSFVEFGPPMTHIFVGYTQPVMDAAALNGIAVVHGSLGNFHMGRPPFFQSSALGPAMPNAWVALNTAAGDCIYAQPVDDPETGAFTIPNVPPGSHQIVIWDDYLDIIIGFYTAVVTEADVDVDVGVLAVNDWFGHMHAYVFLDLDGDGFPNPDPAAGEVGLMDQNINLRWRDGTIYNSMPTDMEGWAPFDEVFPFFWWLVAEVDFTRFQATGLSVVVDEGGQIPLPHHWPTNPSFGILTPQLQPENGSEPYRTELGPVLTQAFQVFAGQTNVLLWGKKPYDQNPKDGTLGYNGGISGVVYYATTRAENDPELAAFEVWEPGIASAQVNLYGDANWDGVRDDKEGNAAFVEPDQDNYPVGWLEGTAPKGIEDVDHNGDGTFDLGDALAAVHTDSFDANLPTDCPLSVPPPGSPPDPLLEPGKCFEGFRQHNQVRPGVFDGGYAFMDIKNGVYIVEVVVPPGYKLVKEEDKNVDFGAEYIPSMMQVPPKCVGDLRFVPQYLSLQTDDAGAPLPSIDPADLIETQFYDPTGNPLNKRPLCNRKQVLLSDGKNGAADFPLFTTTPIATHFAGMVNNDLGSPAVLLSTGFGEKTPAAHIPVAIRDWAGVELFRVYTDKDGLYNGLAPSTGTINLPMPTGLGAAMYFVCVNDRGPIPDPANPANKIPDPAYRPDYAETCYTMQFMTGTTTYLDTPSFPVAAFAGQDTFPLDCEAPTLTPIIKQADGSGFGPWVTAKDQPVTLTSLGLTTVRNSQYNALANPPGAFTEVRDYGFGTKQGSVMVDGKGVAVLTWTDSKITFKAPATGGIVTVKRGDNGLESPIGVTLHIGGSAPVRVPGNYATIQAAVDGAAAGSLVLVGPGVWEETVFLHRNIRLQGSGAFSTTISARTSPAGKYQKWLEKLDVLIKANPSLLLPGQVFGYSPIPGVGPFVTEQGAGVFVMAPTNSGYTAASHPMVDGFMISGSSTGGGVVVNGNAKFLQISSNLIRNNLGMYGGGIRLGHPAVAFPDVVDANNDNVVIKGNLIVQNGGTSNGRQSGEGAGGGISIYTGADGYQVLDNTICGNFTTAAGGGIGHVGLSKGGLISRNKIIFNECFHQAVFDGAGGGVSISGQALVGALTPGSGGVTIEGNLIQGNFSAPGDGGAIRLAWVNGADVQASPLPANWHRIDILDNIVVNNVTGSAGAIALQDAVNVHIIHNTIAHNDSTGSAADAFVNGAATPSMPAPAGLASRPHGADLAAVMPPGSKAYSDPVIRNNIFWLNRAFWYDNTAAGGLGGLRPDLTANPPEAPVYWDMEVLGVPGALDPRFGLLTDPLGYDASNETAVQGVDPMFIDGYFNGPEVRYQTADAWAAPGAAAALDEGGNFVDIHYRPLALTGDYHTSKYSPAVNVGTEAVINQYYGLKLDWDGETRPISNGPDAGADETAGNGQPNQPPTFTTSPPLNATVNVLWQYNVKANDPNGDPLTFSLVNAPAGMTLTPGAPGSATIQWTPTVVGSYAVTVVVTDGLVTVQQAFTVKVVFVNFKPVAKNETFSVGAPGDFVVAAPGVLANDTDANGDVLSALTVNLYNNVPLNGTVTLQSTGGFTFKPSSNLWVGTRTFRYRAFDGIAASNTATTTISKPVTVLQATATKTGNTWRWRVSGLSTKEGQTLTVYIGAPAANKVLGYPLVANNPLAAWGPFNVTLNNSTKAPDLANKTVTIKTLDGVLYTVPLTVN